MTLWALFLQRLRLRGCARGGERRGEQQDRGSHVGSINSAIHLCWCRAGLQTPPGLKARPYMATQVNSGSRCSVDKNSRGQNGRAQTVSIPDLRVTQSTELRT